MLSRQEINDLYASANKLEKEGYDVWANDADYQGHGFKVLLKKKFINVWMSLNVGKPNDIFITSHKYNKQHPNIIDSLMCEEVKKVKTSNVSEVYDLVKQLSL